MRRLLCKDCGSRYPEAGVKTLLPRSPIGEPAEIGRIVKGVAKQPQATQRVIYMNDSPFPLSHNHYDCDSCGESIKPGDEVTCLSVWSENRPVIAEWESEFIE